MPPPLIQTEITIPSAVISLREIPGGPKNGTKQSETHKEGVKKIARGCVDFQQKGSDGGQYGFADNAYLRSQAVSDLIESTLCRDAKGLSFSRWVLRSTSRGK